MTHATPMPGDKAPQLKVEVLDGPPLDLSQERSESFTLVLFYRGVHCPICKTQMEELAGKRAKFAEAGITVHAVSMDSRDRAERQKQEWAIDGLPIGYGLSEASAREWGLYISDKEKEAEPERFAEPGAAVIFPDGRIYALYLQSVPFARPTLDGLFKGLTFVIGNNYPIRGKLAA